MRRFLVVLTGALLLTAVACSLANGKDKKVAAEISFAVAEHNFDTIAQNSEAVYAFVYKNTGKEPLIISNVQTSCGCTVPDWTREPIKKGKSGVVKVKYNTSRTGTFSKTVTVVSNASNSPVELRITGTVTPVDNTQDKK